MIRRPPRSTLFPYTTALPICAGLAASGRRGDRSEQPGRRPEARHHEQARQVVHPRARPGLLAGPEDRKSTRLNSSHANISYAVFCLKKKKTSSNTVLALT